MPRFLLAALLAASPCAADDRPARVPAAPPADEARRDAVARYGVARLQQARDQLADAAKSLEAAARADPAAVAPNRDLVSVYVNLGREPAAVRAAKAVLAADPADFETGHTLGKLLFEAKRFADAASVLRTAADSPRLADRPGKQLSLLRDCAAACDRASDFIGSESALHRAAKLADDKRVRAEITEQLGKSLAAQKRFDASIAAYEAAHALYADPAGVSDPASAAAVQWRLADVHRAKGDPAVALVHLERCLQQNPTTTAPYERLGELLREAGRGADAVPMLLKITERQPANAAAKWAYLAELARAGGGEFTAAHDTFKGLAKGTADPAFFRLVVRVYAEADRPAELLELADAVFPPPPADDKKADKPDVPPDQAARIQALTTAVLEHPRFADRLLAAAGDDARRGHARATQVWELLGWVAQRAGKLEDAEQLFRQATYGGGSDRRELWLMLFETLRRQKKWDELATAAQEAQGRTRRRFFVYYFEEAHAYAEMDRPGEVFRILDGAGRRNGPIVQAAGLYGRLQKARLLVILGRHKPAVAECRAAMAEAGTADEAQSFRYVLADAHAGLRQFDQAEAELRGVLADDPDDVLALNNLGYQLADQGRKLAEAEDLIRRAVDLDADARGRAGHPAGESGPYLDSLGWVLFRRGKLAEARHWLEKAAALPDGAFDPTVWDHLGDVRFRLGDAKGAAAAWHKAEGLYARCHQGRQNGRLEEVRLKLGRAD